MFMRMSAMTARARAHLDSNQNTALALLLGLARPRGFEPL